MYPDLSYVFHDLLGTSVDNWLAAFKTFGVFLGLAFLSAAYIFRLELKRKEQQGLLPFQESIVTYNQSKLTKEAIINALIGFFFLFKIPYVLSNFADFKVDPASLIFSKHGNILVGLLGAIVFGGFHYFMGKKDKDFGKTVRYKQYPSNRVMDITMIAALSGVGGARLFSIFENMDSFIKDPIGTIFSGSGLTVYGGLIVGFAVCYWYVKKMGAKPIHVMDAFAPSFVIGYTVGRMGCQFSGDGDWGIVNSAVKPDWFIFPDWAWSYGYPRNVLGRGQQIQDCVGAYCSEMIPGVYPTPVYEIFMSLVIFGILWFLRKRINIPGMIFFIFLILNGLERFLIEKIRVNDRYDVLGFEWSLSQAIAVGLSLIGIIGAVILWRKAGKEVSEA